MALPSTVRVKLSSETAEAISLTPVVVQDLAIRELIEHMLGVAGKDPQRLCEILMRGTLVSGASRFRWTGWNAEANDLRELLAGFPDPEPERPFAADGCMRAILRGGRHDVILPREAVSRKPLFRRSSFWELLLEVAASAGPAYKSYSYRDRGDRYLCELSVSHTGRLREGSTLIQYSTLREQVRSVAFTQAELLVGR
jgi:hypothetical protein